jgi:tRNA(fMet)-specific endonuclease VapC
VALIVFDSDVLIDALQGRPAERSRVERAIRDESFATTTVGVFELIQGAVAPPDRERVETLLAAAVVLPIEADDARRAADVNRELRRTDGALPAADALVAGVCLARGLALATRNRRHFDRVPGLRIAE